MWFKDGVRHREGAPAHEYAGGGEKWYHNGKLHREDGPALIIWDHKEWWIDGSHVTEEEHARRTAPAQEMTVAQIETALGHKVKVVK